jgi:ankyrin repeat protein
MIDQTTEPAAAHVHRSEFWRELGQLGHFVLTEGIRAAAGKMDTESLMEALDAGVLEDIPNAKERIKAVLKAAIDYGGKLLPVLDKWLERYKLALHADALRENMPTQYTEYAAGVLYDLAEKKDANSLEVIRIYRKHGADPFYEEPNFQMRRSCAADRAFGAGRPQILEALLEGFSFSEDSPLPPLERADGRSLLHYATRLGSADKAQYSACVRVICDHLAPGYRQPYHELYDETLKNLLSTTLSIGVPTNDKVSNMAEMLLIGAVPDDPKKWEPLTATAASGKLFFPGDLLRNAQPGEAAQVIDILLKQGGMNPDVEHEDARLLHAAAYHSHPRVAELLLEAGADHTAMTFRYNNGEDKTPKTARELARELSFPEVAQVIDAYVAKSAIASVLTKRVAP